MLASFFSRFSEDIALDLGTAYSLVYVRGRGIVINEPSVVAVNERTGEVLAIGKKAEKMVGKTPAYIKATKPLQRGVVSDFEVTQQMIKYFIDKAHQEKVFSFSWPRIMVGIPSGVTEVEKKAVKDAAKSAGAREVHLIEEPLAAAIGARLPIQEARGNFIVDIGGGTSEIAVISLGGIVHAESLKVAGDQFNKDIVKYVQDNYNLLIGEKSAEQAKINVGKAISTKSKEKTSLRGRNLVSGLPEEIEVTSKDVRKAMQRSLDAIKDSVKDTIEETPPELLADIMNEGIYLTGGGSLLKGMDEMLEESTGMNVETIEDPLTAVVRGGGVVLEDIENLKEVLTEPEDEKIEE